VAPQGGRGRSTSPELAGPGSGPTHEVAQARCTEAVVGTQPVQSTVAFVVVSRKLEVPGKSLSPVETHQSQQRGQLVAKPPASVAKGPWYRARLVGC
jgi:hypothetical protein